MEYVCLAYYSVAPIEDPRKEIALHQEFFRTRDFKGRIYISEQGINGQASGLQAHAQEYQDWLHTRYPDVPFKAHAVKEHAFPKMTVKYRKQLVAIDFPVDFSQRGESVSPDRWDEMLDKRDANTLVLDVRNDYEWKIGHFEGAELPKLETFRQFPSYAQELKEERDPKKTVVMMYCTGGIRCEFFSAVLKEQGFENVYQLDGGVIQYGLEKGSNKWKGKLFVFDDRLVVPLSEDAEVISQCKHCNTPNDVYYNCANTDCNDLFTCCLDCLKSHKGCCCVTCETAPRVRPYREDGSSKPFRKMAHSCCSIS